MSSALPASPHGDLLRALLPPVSYDAGAHGVATACTLTGLALDRADVAASNTLRGLSPFSSPAWFGAYEEVYNLPHACVAGLGGLDARVAGLARALRERGGISRAYYLWLAQVYGYAVTIKEYRPFTAGSRAGEPLSNGAWRYVWVVQAAQTPVRTFRAGRSCAGEPLRSWGDTGFECLFRDAAPAHTLIHFSYGADHA